MKKTKIVCTIGPASNNEKTLKEMINAGMNVARFNFSHGDYKTQEANLNLVKKVRKELKTAIATMMDTKGPEIRFRDFEGGKINVKKGDTFIVSTKEFLGDNTRGSITYKGLPKDVKVGDSLLVNDGLVQLLIKEIKNDEIITEVVVGGDISNHKGINAPGADLKMPFLSEVDKKDLEFGIEHDYDYIALSFVRTAQDVMDVRKILNDHGSRMKIIAKIESTQGVENIAEILDAADGLMVARGDMGVELPPEKVPYIQKKMIMAANAVGKITITATQMLESMTHNPRPTRAEVADVANAVYDGCSAVMLSGESANGEFPVEAVKMMATICDETERHLHNEYFATNRSCMNLVAKSACDLADNIGVDNIIVFTERGRSTSLVSQVKPKTPVLALTCNGKIYNQNALLYGVNSYLIKGLIEQRELEGYTRSYMEANNIKSAVLLYGQNIDSIKVLM